MLLELIKRPLRGEIVIARNNNIPDSIPVGGNFVLLIASMTDLLKKRSVVEEKTPKKVFKHFLGNCHKEIYTEKNVNSEKKIKIKKFYYKPYITYKIVGNEISKRGFFP